MPKPLFSIDDAWNLLSKGQVVQAAQIFQAAVSAKDQDRSAWTGLFVCGVLSGQTDGIDRLAEERDNAFGDAGSMLCDALILLANNEVLPALASLADSWPSESHYRPLVDYYLGHCQLALGETDQALESLMAAKTGFLEKGAALNLDQADMNLSTTYLQCVNLMDPDAVDQCLIGKEPARPLEEITWLDGATGNGPVFFAAADAKYIRRFAAEFIAGLAGKLPDGCRLHLHIMDPDEASLNEEIAGLRSKAGKTGIDLRFSHHNSAAFAVEKAAYYAGTRFLIGDRIIDHYGCGITVMDIDLVAKTSLERLAETVENQVYARYLRPDFGPGGIEYAAVTCFSRDQGRDFLQKVAQLIRLRMAESQRHLWFVDQAALFQARHWCETNLPDFSAGDLAEIAAFDDLFDHTSAEADKAAIMSSHEKREA
ncbi:hypothetical protein [Aestuariispira insulae]|nr:hypothetical protein [Aestuariispira insulae]